MTRSGVSLETEAALAYSVKEFLARMWEDVEFNMGRDIARFYKADGVFSSGTKLLCRGIGEIETFYEHRRGLGGRVSRHILGNFRFDFGTFDKDARVKVRAMVTHYGATGKPPFQSALPMAIYDAEVIVEWQSDSSWRIVHHHGDPVFIDFNDSPFSRIPAEMSHAARSGAKPAA